MARFAIRDFHRNGHIDDRTRQDLVLGHGLTPGRVILSACQLVLQLESGSETRQMGFLPDREDLRAALLGDVGAARAVMGGEGFDLGEVLALLCAEIEERGMTVSQVDRLLEEAETVSLHVLDAEDPLVPVERGRVTGPWDAGEEGGAGTELLDLGGIRIPVPSLADDIRMEAGADGTPVAVTVVHGSTALQLQAFRRSEDRNWTSVRSALRTGIEASGGEAREWAGPAGVELRVLLPVARSSARMGVRMLGCDGPGWLLRGIISGEGAAPDSQDTWAYDLFLNAVVSPAVGEGRGGLIVLRAPGH
ncbi:DUF3710 domain-containing protein [Streptomyces sp. NPDC090135]|uniref:DUF3710 domain-containing protein n=1 Tax=Streptomyces sp. NPDC090135 TaxID=3365957 RepID=UPI00381E2B0A